ncbi:hypothetical protein [Bradyrhizobium sp. 169]|uniref:hypothetical protein n=1 Tax=Bradyrhizobium sp. 169 TaxID=2782640 RepID=UPI001FFA618F|nr:hypothetical protein [Bradyrhizobium sp. 169]MCK1586904.1 hypothetical protein [Bradyrhizobium sp. 169]
MTKPSIAKLKAIIGADQDIGDIPCIVSLEKINSDEPYWNVTIRGSNVTMRITDPRDIVEYRRFVPQCFKQLNIVFPAVKQAIWLNTLRDAMPRMTVKQADEDTTREGQFKELLETFLTNRTRGKMREDLLRGLPWEDEASRRRYFTMAALAKLLDREGLRNVNRRDIAAWIRALGGEQQGLTIKNYRKRFWWVPSDAVEEAPELDVPTMPEPAI